MKNFFVLIAAMVLSLVGCAVDTSTDSDLGTLDQQFETQTVRTYHLGQKDKDGMPVFDEKTVRLPKIDPTLSGDGLAKAQQALATAACTLPNQIDHFLAIWKNTGLSGSYVCLTGTGDLDLTNVYFSNPFVCLYAPNYATCIAGLRVSGNVRSLWQSNDYASECVFLGPGFSVYEFYSYPATPYAISSAPTNLINATLVTCIP